MKRIMLTLAAVAGLAMTVGSTAVSAQPVRPPVGWGPRYGWGVRYGWVAPRWAPAPRVVYHRVWVQGYWAVRRWGRVWIAGCWR
jgi:hypothetical protein